MAIVSAASKIKAHVEYICEPKPSQYEQGSFYVSVLFMRCDRAGEDGKVWRSFSVQEASQFERGMAVNLIPTIRKNRQTWDIELIAEPTITASVAPSTAPPSMTQVQNPKTMIGKHPKATVANYVDSMGDLYVHCYSTAIAKLPDEVSDTQVQGMASSLFIAAQRKFGLA